MVTKNTRDFSGMVEASLAQAKGTASASPPRGGFMAALTETTTSVPASQDGYMAYSPDYKYPVGSRIRLPLSVIEEDTLQPRAHMDGLELESLAADFELNGQLEDAQVYPANEVGRFKLRSGHRRLRALSSRGAPSIQVTVVEPPDSLREGYVKARALNLQHKVHTYFDDVTRFPQLLSEGVFSTKTELADSLGLTLVDVSRRLKVADLPKVVFDYLRSCGDVFGLTTAYTLTLYWEKVGKDTDLVLQTSKELADRKITVRVLEARLQAVAAQEEGSSAVKKKTRDRAMSVTNFSGIAKGSLRAFDKKIVLSLQEMEPTHQDGLKAKLLQVIQEYGVLLNASAPDVTP